MVASGGSSVNRRPRRGRGCSGTPCARHGPNESRLSVLRATLENQLSAFLANRTGVIADLCDTMAERGVSIEAVMVLDTADVGTVRMVVDNADLAKEVLNDVGAAYVEIPVITVPIPNRLGAFAGAARALAAAHINVEYFYATAAPQSEYTIAVFRVSNPHEALDVEFED